MYTVDIPRLILAAKAIETNKNQVRLKSKNLQELANKARLGILSEEEKQKVFKINNDVVVNDMSDLIDELIGALYSKPATWK